ncbi:MAG: signal recognition particle receptor subunit alpha, partial [Acidobacteria bacterium]|nr:signal recognition particle receptor subunit alpha [Acidobacteriota bacterium]
MRRASDAFGEQLRETARTGRKVDEEFYDDLTEALIAADTGVGVAERVVITLRDVVRNEGIHDTG